MSVIYSVFSTLLLFKCLFRERACVICFVCYLCMCVHSILLLNYVKEKKTERYVPNRHLLTLTMMSQVIAVYRNNLPGHA